MKFVAIAEGKGARIVAHLPDGADVTDLETELDQYRANGGPIAKAATQMLALFAVVADNGRMRSVRLFHEANKKESLYEFRKGDMRVYFFFSSDSGEVFICSHAIYKKQQTTHQRDVSRAVALRDQIKAAKAAGKFRIVSRVKK
ncbi:MAG TPA: type II toxin-antitoxin system RelE/ParE family toxin [Frateuria sp.]|uniref:type II toxin-antitoxin system RelE/ParE family toxin n=1 Tax=Frateuria sp. TaxID=2211372 RepID=UPI002D7FEA98|nr:type II toxin-antitoxin system RelE/ParE family toxin [Frateuria sp.]HET6805984.1 type II toxin-antitoxin system RelE/ParE family toxin [Frateuria sp.]